MRKEGFTRSGGEGIEGNTLMPFISKPQWNGRYLISGYVRNIVGNFTFDKLNKIPSSLRQMSRIRRFDAGQLSSTPN